MKMVLTSHEIAVEKLNKKSLPFYKKFILKKQAYRDGGRFRL